MSKARPRLLFFAATPILLLALFHCTGEDPVIAAAPDGGLPDTPGGDATPGTDAASDPDVAVPACDRGAAFGTPKIVLSDGQINAGTLRGGRLSPNRLELYFSGIFGAGGDSILRADRAKAEDRFGAILRIEELSSDPHNDSRPTLTDDRRNVVFDSRRPDGGAPALYRAFRSNDTEPFRAPERIDVVGVNVNIERDAYLIGDGKTMYWTSERDNLPARILRVEGAAPFQWANGAAAPVNGVNIVDAAGNGNAAPVLTPDELVIYFSHGPSANINGNWEIYRATRNERTGTFATPVLVAELAHGAHDAPTWVSPDECELYFFSTRDPAGTAASAPENAALWMASRPKR